MSHAVFIYLETVCLYILIWSLAFVIYVILVSVALNSRTPADFSSSIVHVFAGLHRDDNREHDGSSVSKAYIITHFYKMKI